MSHITYITVEQYFPDGVKRIVGQGRSCFVGEVDDSTVLKYPDTPDEKVFINVEAKMYAVLDEPGHPNVIRSKGITPNGILLEFATNGSLQEYVNAHPETSTEQRLAWCMQVAKAVSYIHSKRVIHCDIRHDNFLLDGDLALKLVDFQGQHFSEDGEVLLDALSLEPARFRLPREPIGYCNVTTDLFCSGKRHLFVILGHEIFPEIDMAKIDTLEEQEEIQRRFREEEFPADAPVVALKCWKQLYLSADEVLRDLEAVSRGKSLDLRDTTSCKPQKTWWLRGLCNDEYKDKKVPTDRCLTGVD